MSGRDVSGLRQELVLQREESRAHGDTRQSVQSRLLQQSRQAAGSMFQFRQVAESLEAENKALTYSVFGFLGPAGECDGTEFGRSNL